MSKLFFRQSEWSSEDVREKRRRARSPIPENDVWIAALAQQHGESIVSRDRHFDMLGRSLRVEW